VSSVCGECNDDSRERDNDGRTCVARREDFSLQEKRKEIRFEGNHTKER
jgi:hypothetical protein